MSIIYAKKPYKKNVKQVIETAPIFEASSQFLSSTMEKPSILYFTCLFGSTSFLNQRFWIRARSPVRSFSSLLSEILFNSERPKKGGAGDFGTKIFCYRVPKNWYRVPKFLYRRYHFHKKTGGFGTKKITLVPGTKKLVPGTKISVPGTNWYRSRPTPQKSTFWINKLCNFMPLSGNS